MSANVRVMLRRPLIQASGKQVTEMVIVRGHRVVAVLRDDEPVGGVLLRLFKLTPEELRCGLVQLDSPTVWAQTYVRAVVQAFIDYKAEAAMPALPSPAPVAARRASDTSNALAAPGLVATAG